jgi:hypothetical protein
VPPRRALWVQFACRTKAAIFAGDSTIPVKVAGAAKGALVAVHCWKGSLAVKISIDIDCTPEEARQFLGLPDVKPLQESLMKEIERRMLSNLETMDPENLMKTWLPASLEGFEQIQKMFWSQMGRKPKD